MALPQVVEVAKVQSVEGLNRIKIVVSFIHPCACL